MCFCKILKKIGVWKNICWTDRWLGAGPAIVKEGERGREGAGEIRAEGEGVVVVGG